MVAQMRSRRSVLAAGLLAQLAALTAGATRARDYAARRLSGGRWLCPEDDCGYVYDPAKGDPTQGIPPGTALADLPEDWVCPWCGLPHHRWL
jgi:rubredoxin